MLKPILSKILFCVGIVLLICFFGGLIYMYYDDKNTAFSYGSAPISLYYIIHGVIFLPSSILCIIIAFLLRSKSKE